MSMKFRWHQSRSLQYLFSFIFTLAFATPLSAEKISNDQLARSLIEYGATTATALYSAVETTAKLRTSGDNYQKLAMKIKAEIDNGKVASTLVSAPLKLAADTLTLAALADPEPITKVTAILSAYGLQKSGEMAGQAIYDAAQQSAKTILARALKDSNITARDLRNLSAKQFAEKIDDLRIGGKKMREILKDTPEALAILKAHAEDFAQETNAATLLHLKEASEDTQEIKSRLVSNAQQVKQFREETDKALSNIKTTLNSLETKANQARLDLADLHKEVGSNTRSILALAQISSMGWSTDQKIAALDTGMFPEMNPEELAATRKSLESQRSMEQSISNLQTTGHYLDSIGTIASNLGVDPKVVNSIRQGQIAVASITKFISGDWIGGVAVMTGLLGTAAPDASEQRHQQLIAYLDSQFSNINQKLTEILDLQKRTLSILSILSNQLVEIKDKLIGIERLLVLNRSALQNILRTDWQPCDAMIGVLNGQYLLTSMNDYLAQLRSLYFVDCYKQYREFFDARVKSPDWAGTILSLSQFPIKEITDNTEFVTAYANHSEKMQKEYVTIRNFVLAKLATTENASIRYLISLADPRATIDSAYTRDADIRAAAVKLNKYTCNQEIIHPSLRTMVCQGLPPQSSKQPLPNAFRSVVSETLVGPQALRIIDTGIVLSSLVDFLYVDHGMYRTISDNDLLNIAKQGISFEMSAAREENHGTSVLEKLHWLSTGWVLQQSVLYGDFTASLITDTLYDANKRALLTEPATDSSGGIQRLALLAMKSNPVLARNVVMQAMRRALTVQVTLEDGRNMEIPQTGLYALAVANYSGVDACYENSSAKAYLNRILPGWVLAYRAEKGEIGPGMPLRGCQEKNPDVDIGSGLVVVFKDFEVKAPNPRLIDTGEFEQPSALKVSLAYREKISTAQALYNLRKAMPEIPEAEVGMFTRSLLSSKCLLGLCMTDIVTRVAN